MNCKTCKHWDLINKDRHWLRAGEIERARKDKVPREYHDVGLCLKVRAIEPPGINGAAVYDMERYAAELMTGEQFSCPQHELSRRKGSRGVHS